MRKFLFILIMLPDLLLGQRDSTKQTFKIGDRRVVLLAGKNIYFENHPLPISELIKGGRLKLFGYGDSTTVVSYIVSYSLPNYFSDRFVSGSIFPKGLIDTLQEGCRSMAYLTTSSGIWIIIKNIVCRSKDGTLLNVAGIVLKIVN